MIRQLSTLAAVGLTLAACSNVDNKRAAGSFEYAEQSEAKSITIPEGLRTPQKSKEFEIVDEKVVKGPVGENVDVRAPSLALPVAASSRVEPNTKTATIWFDQVLDEKNLTDFINAAVNEQLGSDLVSATTIAENSIESGWYTVQMETGTWPFESLTDVEQYRFKFDIAPKPHGRSVALTASMIEYKNLRNADEQIDIIDKQRAEMKMLNEVVAQVDFKYRLVQRENRLMKANQKLLSIGENVEGEPAYIVEMELDDLWQNLPLFFEDYGFSVADLNETKKIYFVDFVKPDNSLWAKIWGDEVPVIDVADARYQFALKERGESTILTIYNSDGVPVPADVLERIFPVMEPGLSFRNVF